MPSDAQRISIIKMLCDKGYSDHVFISHDIHTKHRLVIRQTLNCTVIHIIDYNIVLL